MSDGFQFLDIVLFAMVAAFLVLRLRSALGKRTGHQRPRSIAPPPDDRAPEPPPADRDAEAEDAAAEDAEAEDEYADPDDPISQGIANIRNADRAFDPDEFLTGARGAFDVIVQAFAEGDADTLRDLLSEDVYENFSDAIEQRKADGHVLETTIIGTRSAQIVEADLVDGDAAVTVSFLTEQINVTRDSEGRILDGDPSHVNEITDIWTFRRDVRSRDPNWKLVETRSQN